MIGPFLQNFNPLSPERWGCLGRLAQRFGFHISHADWSIELKQAYFRASVYAENWAFQLDPFLPTA
jgi:hypothetical protein